MLAEPLRGVRESLAVGADRVAEIRRGSLDYYATLRSLYRQRRADEINNGELPPQGIGPEFSLAPGLETSERPAAPPRAAAVSASSSSFIRDPAGPIPTALDP